ncbi:MAG: 5-oxoprolinase subunit PxpA [Candidatus Aminicenantales bacterium]
MSNTIDINSDVGERPEALADGSEERLIRQITSANIACGGHAGDDESMTRVMTLCARYGVGIGAHPSYPDRASFGRTELNMPADLIEESVCRQVGALAGLASKLGLRVRHVKPHGALYNTAAHDERTALAVARGTARAGVKPILFGLANSKALEVWRKEGFTAIGEAFADRRYESDGSLRSRRFEDSLITDPDLAARQALRIAADGKVLSVTGEEIAVEARTICVHSDTAGSAAIAERIRRLLAENGFIIAPLVPDR